MPIYKDCPPFLLESFEMLHKLIARTRQIEVEIISWNRRHTKQLFTVQKLPDKWLLLGHYVLPMFSTFNRSEILVETHRTVPLCS